MNATLLGRVRTAIFGSSGPTVVRAGDLALIAQVFPKRSGELLKAAEGFPLPHRRAEALIYLAPHLPQSDFPELLGCIDRLPDDESLTAALVGVAPRVSDELLHAPRSASMRISQPELRKLAVLALDEQWPLLQVQRTKRLRDLMAQVSQPLPSVIHVALHPLLHPPDESHSTKQLIELQRLLSPLSEAERDAVLDDLLQFLSRPMLSREEMTQTFGQDLSDTPPGRDTAPAPSPVDLDDQLLAFLEDEPEAQPAPADVLEGSTPLDTAAPAPAPVPPPAAAMPAPAAAPQAGAPKPRAKPGTVPMPAAAPPAAAPQAAAAPKPAPAAAPAAAPPPAPAAQSQQKQRPSRGRTRSRPKGDAAGGHAPGRPEARGRPAGNVVNTGFSAMDAPAAGLDRHRALVCGSSYYFWLDIGLFDTTSIEKTPQPLPALPVDAEVDVILFDFARDERGERPHLALRGGKRGVLRIVADGSSHVIQPAAVPDRQVLAENDPLRKQRLFFQVDAPVTAGEYALRVGIYYKNNLLQSRLVRALVATEAHEAANALSSELDYVITHALSPSLMRKLPPQRLSVLLNDDGEGLVGFRFVGDRNFQRDTTLSATKLKTQIDMARQALHMASWGSPDAYTRDGKLPDRYADGKLNLERLTGDLVGLASAGYRLWISLGLDLAGGKRERQDLVKLMRKSGSVQLALKRSASSVFPVAMLYDHAIDAQTADTLCPAFKKALQGRKPLEAEACFQGECPSIGQLKVVCPSGFWGFRHELGIPLSVADGDQLVTDIPVTDGIDFKALAHHDLALRAKHLDVLQKLRPTVRWSYAEGRDPAVDLLRSTEPHIVYFYCHGGYRERDKLPYLDLGGAVALTPDYLTAREVCWYDRRPLVFLNGCHTTALTPEIAIHLVNAFLVEARAAGVLGTEVTVFETLAAPFAEHCLREFVSGTPIGTAIRRARLAILATGNPLGLAYIPFVTSALRLTEASAR